MVYLILKLKFKIFITNSFIDCFFKNGLCENYMDKLIDNYYGSILSKCKYSTCFQGFLLPKKCMIIISLSKFLYLFLYQIYLNFCSFQYSLHCCMNLKHLGPKQLYCL